MQNDSSADRINTATPNNSSLQAIAKRVLGELTESLTRSSTERSIANWAANRLAHYGAKETWYYNCPALVLLGSRSCLSISGSKYQPGDEPVGEKNLITVDLSPKQNTLWGDCARSFFFEGGQATTAPQSPEFVDGMRLLEHLHEQVGQFVTPRTRFCDLHRFANHLISEAGYENLDFLENVGHSIAARLDQRVYVDRDNQQPLGDVDCFTFEPHIRVAGGRWGYKHEEIYYFNESGAAAVL